MFRKPNKLVLFPQSSLDRLAPWRRRALPLVLWFAYHYSRTGFVFGNPEFFATTCRLQQSVASPAGSGIAALANIYLYGLWAVTGLTMFAMTCRRGREWMGRKTANRDPIQITFAVVILPMLLRFRSLEARCYPATCYRGAAVILIGVSTIWRRLSCWKIVVGALAALFVAGWFWNPPYSFLLRTTSPTVTTFSFTKPERATWNNIFAHALVLTAWTLRMELKPSLARYGA